MAQKVGQFVNPVLEALRQLGGSAQPSEVCEAVVKSQGLAGSPILEETLRSGVSKFENRIAWVRMYLVQAGYIDRSKRGVWALTEKGRSAPMLTDAEVLALLKSVQRRGKTTVAQSEEEEEGDEEESGEEDAVPEVTNYREQLLDIMRNLSPKGFEHLCQRLLRESGFDHVSVTGRTNDGGIDGIGVLKVNQFVTFKVLFQCKRYLGTVGSPAVRDFRGSMQGRADKGIILTTGTFSVDAMKEATRDGVPPIELVDGERMVALFESLELGLTPRTTYDVDQQFFDQFRGL